MQLHQFEKVYKEMEKEFGKIKSGDEETHVMMLLPMEGNSLKTHRKYPSSNSRRLREAIALALFKIKGYCTAASYDTDKFRDVNNERLEHALLMAFDPFTNTEHCSIWSDNRRILRTATLPANDSFTPHISLNTCDPVGQLIKKRLKHYLVRQPL